MDTALQLFYDTSPSMPSVYWNIFRRQFRSSANKPLQNLDGEILSVKINPIKLLQYQKVCRLSKSRYLPLLYPQILASSLHGNLLTSQRFPFNALGLLHTESKVIQYRPIHYTESMNMTAHLGNYDTTEKGTFFDISTHVFIRREIVWEGTTRILAKNPQKRKSSNNPNKQIENLATSHTNESLIDVPSRIGLQYAFVSGDFNPIHLASPLAWMFGLPSSIAHGNWLLARTIGTLCPNANNRALKLEASFKKPVAIGSELKLKWGKEEKTKNFSLTNTNYKKLHMVGKVEEL